MKSIIIRKIIVTSVILPVTISLLLTACNLRISDEIIEVTPPIPDPNYLEYNFDMLSDLLYNRREIYEQQILWDQEELDRKIKQLKGQVGNSQTTDPRLEINKLLQQQALVQQKIETLLAADKNNWEQARFIADEELANLQQIYNRVKVEQINSAKKPSLNRPESIESPTKTSNLKIDFI